MEDDLIKEYVHADLHGLSEEEFSKKFRPMVPKTRDLLDNMELALLYLNADRTGHPARYNEAKESVFNINTFDGAWLLSVDGIGRDNLGFFAPLGQLQATISMFKDFNVKTFMFGGEDKMSGLQKWRVLPPKECRHLKTANNILERRTAMLSSDEKWYTYGDYRYGLERKREDGSRYTAPVPVSISPNFYISNKHVLEFLQGPDYKEELDKLNMAINIRLSAYYEWFVYIREDDKSIGVKIPIAPESSKEVFALRDTPAGSKRKKAICHFVKEHYRAIKSEFSEEERNVLIKQHLRGEAKFNWRGLQVNIIPAEYDLNRVKTRKKFLTI